MNRALDELRHALRALLGTPGFTATAVFILALGIGANIAIFSLVDRVLLQPLPYREPDRLVAVWGAVPIRDRGTNPLSAPDFLDWQREARQVEGMAGVDNYSANLTGGEEPLMVRGGRVSWNFFQVIGVHPVLGRAFTPEEDRAGGPRAVILTDEFWKSRFGGDPSLVGRSIHLDGTDTQVVGILPAGFSFLHGIRGAQILVPMAFTKEELGSRGTHFFVAVARLKPGATAASCQEDLKRVAAALALAYPDEDKNFTARVIPLHDQVVRNDRGTLLVLLGAVAFVLLIACANLMNLMLARAAKRQREMAIRAALGAGPWTLVRAALTESLILGVLAGAVGLVIARWTMAGLVQVLGLRMPGLKILAFEPRLVAFTLAVSILASLLFGLVPALKSEGKQLADALKEGKGVGGSSHPRLRGLLVASETALATALLIGAGLMLRSLQHLYTVDPGFRSDHVLTARVALPDFKYGTDQDREALAERFRQRLTDMPGVVSAAVNDTLPMAGSTSSSSYDVGGQPKVEGQEAINHHVTPGYFKTLGIPILRGRDFAPGETDAVIISEALARRNFPGSDPLQGRLSMDASSGYFMSVVGVVGNVHHEGLALEPRPEMYYPATNTRSGGMGMRILQVAVRTTSAPEALAPAVTRALRELDPDLPLGSVRTLDAILDLDRSQAQARSLLLGSFAGLALLLAGVGIYAVINFLTALRTREIGIRMALGARVQDVLALVMGQGLRMALGGVAAGVLIALALGRFLESLIAGVQYWDPSTLGLVTVTLALVGAVACLLPALRAAKVDPMVALRNE